MATRACARCGSTRELPWRCIVCGAGLCGRCSEEYCGEHKEQRADLKRRNAAREAEQRLGGETPPPRRRPN